MMHKMCLSLITSKPSQSPNEIHVIPLNQGEQRMLHTKCEVLDFQSVAGRNL